jgi:hypothetical protein
MRTLKECAIKKKRIHIYAYTSEVAHMIISSEQVKEAMGKKICFKASCTYAHTAPMCDSYLVHFMLMSHGGVKSATGDDDESIANRARVVRTESFCSV